MSRFYFRGKVKDLLYGESDKFAAKFYYKNTYMSLKDDIEYGVAVEIGNNTKSIIGLNIDAYYIVKGKDLFNFISSHFNNDLILSIEINQDEGEKLEDNKPEEKTQKEKAQEDGLFNLMVDKEYTIVGAMLDNE